MLSPSSLQRGSHALRGAITCALLAIVTACSGDSAESTESSANADHSTPEAIELPTSVEIADPQKAISKLEMVEDMTEEAADRLLTFSDKIRRRDFSAASAFLSDSFAGESFDGLEVQETKPLHLATTETVYEPAGARIVGKRDFIEGIRSHIGPWSRMESVIWKVKGGEFEANRNAWGKLRLYVHMTGQRADGGWSSMAAWGHCRVIREAGLWVLDRFDLTSFAVTERSGTIFTDVSTSAGVAKTGVRFGKPGNTSYAFNGVASADVNADGRWDFFVPSDGRNYFYLGQSDGTFAEEAEARGVIQPDAGTGPVFFDVDNDGDQDLLVGQVGWARDSDEFGGRSLQLYVNDGEGEFTNRSADFGLEHQRFIAYSVTVLDYDSDGWLDVFVCGYGQVEVNHNNSWIEATNGSPNGLLRNIEGRGFENVAADLGLEGTSWSYAAAAADYDQDGDTDLYVANDYGTNQLWNNQGDGTFEEVAKEEGVSDPGNGMGVSWGDLNSDGLLDLYVSNMSSTAGNRILGRLTGTLDSETHAMLKKLAAGNSIFIAKAGGGFDSRPKSAGGLGGSWAWSPAICDLDLDGFLDVYLANGFVTGDQPFDT